MVSTRDNGKWKTDECYCSGWQSDLFGSLIHFLLRLRIMPSISITHMTSHSTFGHLRLSLGALSSDKEEPLLGCGDSLKKKLVSSIMIVGDRNVFSLVVFPTEYQGDVNSHDK